MPGEFGVKGKLSRLSTLQRCPSPSLLLLFAATVVAAFMLGSLHPPTPLTSAVTQSGSRSYGRSHIPGLKCVRAMKVHQTKEGMGSLFQLNQLALLLASFYDTDLAFPDVDSHHEYNYQSMFSTCGDKDDATFPQKCVLKQNDHILKVCPRADCECMASQYGDALRALVKKGCPIVGIENDGYKRTEFSGCLRAAERYFGTKGKPDWEYDAIHYRMGDLAHLPGGKSFSELELYFLIKTMCALSDRDIVVVTEGLHPIPVCGNRIVLADTSVREALQIFQHAKHLSVGVSAFAHVIQEVAHPEHMIVKWVHARRYEYVDCEKWSLVCTDDGSTFHFESKAEMLNYVMSTRDIHRELKHLGVNGVSKMNITKARPKRIWTPEMMAPAVLSA